MTMRVARCALAAVLFCGLIACSSSPTVPTPTVSTETFTGVINPLGTSSHQFTVNYSLAFSDASVTISGVTTVANATPQTITIGIAFGNVNLGACTRSTNYVNPVAPLNTALPTTGAPFIAGVYCVQIFDNPDLPTVTEPLNYTITLKHY